jgi:hypothetical protein
MRKPAPSWSGLFYKWFQASTLPEMNRAPKPVVAGRDYLAFSAIDLPCVNKYK